MGRTSHGIDPPPGAKVETENHHKTMKFKAPEAEILRTPIKIEKLSLRNRSGSGFTMNFEFHGFQKKKRFFFFCFFVFYLWGRNVHMECGP